MADDFSSDEDKYANESFENETDNEIPEGSDVGSDNYNDDDQDTEPDAEPEQDLYSYSRSYFSANSQNALQRRKEYVHYDSTSDEDEDDVVISETIAEINPQPMNMDEAVTPVTTPCRRTSHESPVRLPTVAEDMPIMTTTDTETEIEQTDESEDSEPEPEQYQEPEQYLEPEQYQEPEPNEEQTVHATESHEELVLQQTEHLELESTVNESDILLTSNMLQSVIDDDTPYPVVSLDELRTCVLDEDANHDAYEQRETDDYTGADATETEAEFCEPRVEFTITSQTPTSFNSDDYAFHMNFVKKTPSTGSLKMKNAVHRMSWSFSNERMREIDRQNQILLKKILTQKPTYAPKPQKSKPKLPSGELKTTTSNTRLTSAAVNRKKQQRQIDLDNQVLKRKIEAITLRRPLL